MIVHPGFLDHWKTTMLVEQLNDPAAPIYLLRLWEHCQNSKRAIFDRLPEIAVKAICRFPGTAEELNGALIDCGWIKRTQNEVHVLGWEEHNAQLIANWANGSKGGRPRKKSNSTQNPSVTQSEPMGNPSITHGLPMANPTLTDKSRLDKIRLDKSLKSIVDSGKPEPDEIVKTTKKEEHGKLLQTWNEYSGNLPKARAVSEARATALNRFLRNAKKSNSDPIALMAAAAKRVSTEKFWQENMYGLDNLLAGDKYLQKAEAAYQHHVSPPPTAADDLLAFFEEEAND